MVRVGETRRLRQREIAIAQFHVDWKRSARGNYWKRLENGETLTVFPRLDEEGDVRGYAYCVRYADGETVWSKELYRTEDGAVVGVFEYLEG